MIFSSVVFSPTKCLPCREGRGSSPGVLVLHLGLEWSLWKRSVRWDGPFLTVTHDSENARVEVQQQW